LRCAARGGRHYYSRRTSLKQALFNLVSNAIKFTPPGVSIRLAAERRADELLLIVTDTELGASLPVKPQPGTPRSAGALGLSLVKSLFQLHGGTVAIDATAGRGTSTVCRLPASAGEFAGFAAADPIASRQAA
jgi:signal transduction histidine kinase